MQLRIAPVRPISEIQNEFSNKFPYLKLEFFQNKLNQQPDFSPKQIIPRQKKLGNIQLSIADGYIDIKPEMKVKDLEKKFKEDFSLSVQVFRRSGNVWLQTSMTDDWTLRQQNEHGREISQESNGVMKNGTSDFDLERDADH